MTLAIKKAKGLFQSVATLNQRSSEIFHRSPKNILRKLRYGHKMIFCKQNSITRNLKKLKKENYVNRKARLGTFDSKKKHTCVERENDCCNSVEHIYETNSINIFSTDNLASTGNKKLLTLMNKKLKRNQRTNDCKLVETLTSNYLIPIKSGVDINFTVPKHFNETKLYDKGKSFKDFMSAKKIMKSKSLCNVPNIGRDLKKCNETFKKMHYDLKIMKSNFDCNHNSEILQSNSQITECSRAIDENITRRLRSQYGSMDYMLLRSLHSNQNAKFESKKRYFSSCTKDFESGNNTACSLNYLDFPFYKGIQKDTMQVQFRSLIDNHKDSNNHKDSKPDERNIKLQTRKTKGHFILNDKLFIIKSVKVELKKNSKFTKNAKTEADVETIFINAKMSEIGSTFTSPIDTKDVCCTTPDLKNSVSSVNEKFIDLKTPSVSMILPETYQSRNSKEHIGGISGITISMEFYEPDNNLSKNSDTKSLVPCVNLKIPGKNSKVTLQNSEKLNTHVTIMEKEIDTACTNLKHSVLKIVPVIEKSALNVNPMEPKIEQGHISVKDTLAHRKQAVEATTAHPQTNNFKSSDFNLSKIIKNTQNTTARDLLNSCFLANKSFQPYTYSKNDTVSKRSLDSRQSMYNTQTIYSRRKKHTNIPVALKNDAVYSSKLSKSSPKDDIVEKFFLMRKVNNEASTKEVDSGVKNQACDKEQKLNARMGMNKPFQGANSHSRTMSSSIPEYVVVKNKLGKYTLEKILQSHSQLETKKSPDRKLNISQSYKIMSNQPQLPAVIQKNTTKESNKEHSVKAPQINPKQDKHPKVNKELTICKTNKTMQNKTSIHSKIKEQATHNKDICKLPIPKQNVLLEEKSLDPLKENTKKSSQNKTVDISLEKRITRKPESEIIKIDEKLLKNNNIQLFSKQNNKDKSNTMKPPYKLKQRDEKDISSDSWLEKNIMNTKLTGLSNFKIPKIPYRGFNNLNSKVKRNMKHQVIKPAGQESMLNERKATKSDVTIKEAVSNTIDNKKEIPCLLHDGKSNDLITMVPEDTNLSLKAKQLESVTKMSDGKQVDKTSSSSTVAQSANIRKPIKTSMITSFVLIETPSTSKNKSTDKKTVKQDKKLKPPKRLYKNIAKHKEGNVTDFFYIANFPIIYSETLDLLKRNISILFMKKNKGNPFERMKSFDKINVVTFVDDDIHDIEGQVWRKAVEEKLQIQREPTHKQILQATSNYANINSPQIDKTFQRLGTKKLPIRTKKEPDWDQLKNKLQVSNIPKTKFKYQNKYSTPKHKPRLRGAHPRSPEYNLYKALKETLPKTFGPKFAYNKVKGKNAQFEQNTTARIKSQQVAVNDNYNEVMPVKDFYKFLNLQKQAKQKKSTNVSYKDIQKTRNQAADKGENTKAPVNEEITKERAYKQKKLLASWLELAGQKKAMKITLKNLDTEVNMKIV